MLRAPRGRGPQAPGGMAGAAAAPAPPPGPGGGPGSRGTGGPSRSARPPARSAAAPGPARGARRLRPARGGAGGGGGARSSAAAPRTGGMLPATAPPGQAETRALYLGIPPEGHMSQPEGLIHPRIPLEDLIPTPSPQSGVPPTRGSHPQAHPTTQGLSQPWLMILAGQRGVYGDADPTRPPALRAPPGLLKAILGDRLAPCYPQQASCEHSSGAEPCHHRCSFSSSLCPFPPGSSSLRCGWAGKPHKTGAALSPTGEGQPHPGGSPVHRRVRARGTEGK